MKYQAVLFDLDGTLLDTAPDFLTATCKLAEEFQYPFPNEETIRRAVTHGSKGIIERIFKLDTADPTFETTRQRLLEIYLDCLAERTRPFPGIAELLAKLGEQDVRWGIVTNKPVLYTNAILAQLPLHPAPAVIVCPDHVSNTKPDPEPMHLACEQLSLEPSQTLYIGDHRRDVQCGLAAGAATVAAAYGYLEEGEDPTSWGAHHVVYSAGEILDLLS